MDDQIDEAMQVAIEESKKLFCRPWEDVQKEIQKRQTLGRLPPLTNISLPESPERTKKPNNLPPSKPHI